MNYQHLVNKRNKILRESAILIEDFGPSKVYDPDRQRELEEINRQIAQYELDQLDLSTVTIEV